MSLLGSVVPDLPAAEPHCVRTVRHDVVLAGHTGCTEGNTTVRRANGSPLSSRELERVHAYWRAANYLSVGQIYLLSNPLLREELRVEHIKPRLLGHWGTTPALNLVYTHLNRVIGAYDLDMMYVIGPGQGGPAIL